MARARRVLSAALCLTVIISYALLLAVVRLDSSPAMMRLPRRQGVGLRNHAVGPTAVAALRPRLPLPPFAPVETRPPARGPVGSKKRGSARRPQGAHRRKAGVSSEERTRSELVTKRMRSSAADKDTRSVPAKEAATAESAESTDAGEGAPAATVDDSNEGVDASHQTATGGLRSPPISDEGVKVHQQQSRHHKEETGASQRRRHVHHQHKEATARNGRRLQPPSAAAAAAAARNAQCSAVAARELDARGEQPPLATADALTPQSTFAAEQTVSLAAFNLSLLPRAASLDANRFGRTASCAVVGCSGSLLSRKDGEFIDSHDQVLRINRVRVLGFEAHAGRRTTLNLFWGHQFHLESFDQQQSSSEEKAVGLVVPVKGADVTFYFEAAANRTRLQTDPGLGASLSPVYLLSDAAYVLSMRELCNATQQGREWVCDSPLIRPSSGLIAVSFATLACRSVSLFGLTDNDPCAPHHYFDEPPANCTTDVPKRYQHDFHWFRREHEVYRLLAQHHDRNGCAQVRVYS